MQRGYGAASIIKEVWLRILVSATNIFISMWGGVKWLFNWVDFIKFQLPVLNHSRCPSIHLEAIISSPGSLLPPPHSPNYPPVPTPSFLYCYTICSKSSPEGGPPPTTFSPLLQVAEGISFLPPSLGCRRHSSRFHSPHSLLFCLPLILLSLMWGLSFSSSLASLGAPRAPFCPSLPLCCVILFHPFFPQTSYSRRWES